MTFSGSSSKVVEFKEKIDTFEKKTC